MAEPPLKKSSPEEPREHAVLTNDQVRAAKERARKRLEDEREREAIRQLEADEVQRLRLEEGMYVGGLADEPVSITVDLAEHSGCISLNGTPYWHGHTYTVPRHVADTLRDIMFRGWVHQERDIEGKDLQRFYQRPHDTAITAAGTKNSPLSR